ncbi:protein-tyrosine phosphatase [Roseivivax lentus]|uniref:protein-tyrosine-phosphatase n=1 Tax=Roseivivax lentus TaxID=633194 RepID=A0A1N7KV03_9RHOB|nr:low molecular weight protein-tyrosine-phosphatase [Roseivivax lentus]SIS65381.1 protein-tyrosine phosphatase [Roseivivax lentus]
MTTSILFVCLGNICRSPSAEGVVRAKAARRGLDLRLDSAGTGDWHVGKPPYPPMIAAAGARGYDLTDLRARQVNRADFDRFDLIVAMDGENLSDLRAMRPESGAEVMLFTDALEEPGTDHVPDPYYTRDFEGALDLVERAAEALLDRIAGRA